MSRALQQTIHAGCRALGIDAETRRDLQLVVTGKASMSDMNEAELRQVVKALRARGFTAAGGKQRPAAPRADLRLVHVLWRKLGEAGALEKPGRAGLNAFVRSRFGEAWGTVPADIDMLREHKKIATVIEALKDWCARTGLPLDPGR